MKKYSLDKNKIKVLLLEGVHHNAIEYFRKNGYSDIEYYEEALTDNELLAKLRHTHIIGIRSRQKLNRNLLKKAPKLIAIGCFSIGTNQVDLKTAKMMGIPVFNAPFFILLICSFEIICLVNSVEGT